MPYIKWINYGLAVDRPLKDDGYSLSAMLGARYVMSEKNENRGTSMVNLLYANTIKVSKCCCRKW